MKNHLRSLLHLAGATLALLILIYPDTVQAQQPVPVFEYPILAWTNRVRQHYGRPMVAPNPRLALAAQKHALNMAAQETMSHSLDGLSVADRVKRAGYAYAAVGENVAFNFGYPNPDWKLFEGWMNSPGHFQNIIQGEFTEIGVGVAQSATGKIYACQVFGRPALLATPRGNPYQIYGGQTAWTTYQREPSFYFYADDFLAGN